MAKKEAIGKLVRIKSHYLRLAQMEYSNALQDVYKQVSLVEKARQDVAHFREKILEKQRQGAFKSDELKDLSEFEYICRQNLAREEKSLKEKEQLAEILHKKMEEANKEKEIAERLYKGILAREEADRERKERKVIDESATSRFFYREQ